MPLNFHSSALFPVFLVQTFAAILSDFHIVISSIRRSLLEYRTAKVFQIKSSAFKGAYFWIWRFSVWYVWNIE